MPQDNSESVFTSHLFDDPYPEYRRLRTERPVHLDRAFGEMVFTRYADVVAGLKHPRVSSGRVAEGGLPIPAFVRPLMAPVLRALSQQMLFSDPPDHTRLRGLANKAFTPRVVDGMRARIQQLADRLLDRLDASRPADLIADFAGPLPVYLIAEMLGVKQVPMRRFKAWSDDLALFIGGTTLPMPVVLARGARGMLQLRRCLRAAVRERRRNPEDNLLGELIRAEEQGDALTEDELVSNAVLLLVAGHETTTNLIGNGLLTLLRNPDQLRLLRDQPDLIERAVEEVLRYESPVQWTGRIAVEELEINEVRVPAGQRLAFGMGAANRDPVQFPLPDQFDIRRADNRHVAFSHGIHFCLGAALARLEGQIAIGTVIQRYPNLRLTEERLQWRPNFTLRGLRSLHLHLS
jgi:pimeloyl-[acyl-carrier protein] synthase